MKYVRVDGKMDKTISKIRKYCLDSNLPLENSSVVVALSGGADSVCLLYALNELKDSFNIKLFAVHVEHGIRGEEAILDMNFAEELCGKMGIPLEIYRFNIPKIAKERGLGLEEAGRIMRYEALEKSRIKMGAEYIAVAHHMNDLAETVIFNMVRGSGLKGLSGIQAKRERIIRPLLGITRNEIETYLLNNNISYRTDSTNLSNDYSRNLIRNSVMPMLNDVVGNAANHIANLTKEIDEANAYLEKVASKEYAILAREEIKNEGMVYQMDAVRLTELDSVIARYVVKIALSKCAGGLKDIDSVHINKILDLASGACGRKFDLPYGILAIREKEFVVIGKKERLDCSKDFLDVPVLMIGNDIFVDGGRILIEITDNDFAGDIPKEMYTKWFDYDKIEHGLHVRNQMEGDYLIVDDLGNRKKLSRYFIDEKVSKTERKNVILLADGNHIVWIIGGRISEYYKVKAETKHVVKVTYIANGKN